MSDQDRYVISLPPLTNAERSKVNNFEKKSLRLKIFLFKLSPSTESILIEITSGTSMDICRRVMDALLHQMLQHQLGKKNSDLPIRQVLTLQQTRVVDDKGQLKTTFPSRADLDWNENSILIERK